MTIIDTPHDYEYEVGDDRVTTAVYELKDAVVEAFKQHDRDLRTEVEKVNSQIRVLIGAVALVLAVGLIWPKLKK